MKITIQQHCKGINWQQVADIMSYHGLSDQNAAFHQQAFENSDLVVFLLQQEKVVGFGRALTDGVSQAAIYNIALAQHLHGKGYGRLIIDMLVEQVKHCNIILYTHPKTVKLYEHLGFKLMKTGMAKYQIDHLSEMAEMGFI